MTTLLHLKEIYLNAFRQFSNFLVRNTLRILAWFAIAMFLIVLYAFWYRIFTGFIWD